MKYNATNTVIIAIVVGVLGFFGGMKYQQSRVGSNRQFMMRGGGQFGAGTRGQSGGGGGNRMGFRPVTGEIISTDEASITVKLTDGSSKIVMFSDSTAINKAEKAPKTELTQGAKVMVFGRENTDGTLEAQNIQLNPITPQR